MPQEPLVRCSVLERAGRIATRLEYLHQPERDARIIGVVSGSRLPPLHRPSGISLSLRQLGKQLQRSRVFPGQSRALPLHPPLELRRGSEEKAIQEAASVELDRSRQVTHRDRPLKTHHVARDHVRVEAQVVARGQDHVLAERFAQHIHSLAEKIARVLGIALRPEVGGELVARNGSRMGGREHGEQRKAMAMDGRPGQRATIGLE